MFNSIILRVSRSKNPHKKTGGERKKKFYCFTWKGNMLDKTGGTFIRDTESNETQFTQITYLPDLERFDMREYTSFCFIQILIVDHIRNPYDPN